MKKLLLLPILMLLFVAQMRAEGIEFFHGTFEEAKAKAAAEEKIIFVDAFAVWCGPCKRMANQVFPEKEVGDFFNKNFVNLKMDMERGEGLTFRKSYPVSAFPTLFFIDAKGEIVHQVKGAQSAENLIKLGKFALGKVDYSGEYAKRYEAGERDPQLVFDYVKSLNKAGKSSAKYANEYLRGQKDLNTDFNLRFLLEAATSVDSRIFTLLTDRLSKVQKLVGEKEVTDRIYAAAEATAQKATEFQNNDLLDEAKAAVKKYAPARYDEFAAMSNMDFYSATRDAKNYLKACKDCAKKVYANDADELRALAKDIVTTFQDDPKSLDEAEKIAKAAVDQGSGMKHYYTYAEILLLNGKKADALDAATKSLELVEQNDRRSKMAVEQLIQRIEG